MTNEADYYGFVSRVEGYRREIIGWLASHQPETNPELPYAGLKALKKAAEAALLSREVVELKRVEAIYAVFAYLFQDQDFHF
jgi:hypothetical protein